MALFTKMEIRELSRALGLPTADKPSDACLATRIPYGTPIDKVLLSRIGESERRIKELGIGKVRVRSHGSVARIEVEEEDLATTLLMRHAIWEALREFGFIHIALDLLGYRTGSMNENDS